VAGPLTSDLWRSSPAILTAAMYHTASEAAYFVQPPVRQMDWTSPLVLDQSLRLHLTTALRRFIPRKKGPVSDPTGADHSMSLVGPWGGVLTKETVVVFDFRWVTLLISREH